MGAIIGALIGRHLAHTEEQRKNAENLVLPKIASYIKDPVSSPYEPDEIDEAVQTGIQMHLYNKEHGKLLQGQIDLAKNKRAAAKTREAMQAQTQQKQPLGVPSMTPGQDAPSAFNPMSAQTAQPQAQGNPPDGMLAPEHKAQLLKMALAAQQQQAQSGPPATWGLSSSPPPMTKPPFADGAAGAPLADEKPAMKTASVNGTIGFGGPAPPPLSTPPDDFHTVWTAGPNAARRLGQRLGQKAVGAEEVGADYFKQRYGNDPRYKALTDRQQLELETGKHITTEPHFNIPGVTMSTAEDRDMNGMPVLLNTPGRRSFLNGQWVFTPEGGRLGKQLVTNADGSKTVKFVNMFTGQSVAATEASAAELTSAPTLRMVKITKGDGSTHEMGVNPVTGRLVTDDPNLRGIDPSMLLSETNHFLVVTQPDGSSRLEPVTSTTGKLLRLPAAATGLPAEPVPPGQTALPAGPAPVFTPGPAPAQQPGARAPRAGPLGKVVGGRPLTPEQTIKNSQMAGQLNNTIGVLKALRDKADMLGSMLTSGKIAMQTGPQGFWKGIINKNMPLTEDEADLASKWQLATEGIMQMRIPMGAAGFRGPEGLDVLESNKGRLGQHPEIIKRVLAGALREFQAQRKPLVDGAKTYGYQVDPEFEADFDKKPVLPPLPAGAETESQKIERLAKKHGGH